MSQHAKAETFRSLHAQANPLFLFNSWDAGSTQAVAKAGAAAIATSSWAIAASHGLGDGENMPLATVLATIRQIADVTTLPITVDLESGYGEDVSAVEESVRLSIEAGAIGCNLEDSRPSDGRVRSPTEAAQRLAAARRAADAHCPGYFINARTDVFFQNAGTEAEMVAEVIERAALYAKAGADGLFVPGLTKLALIREIAAASPLPLNIMRVNEELAVTDLAAAGVKRISHGPYPYLLAMAALERAAANR
ncbi:isocitrate lyase/PEP mutase family protein [Dyella mobilis]|uniref:Isocitrate lyase/phosphoenolpyruvate mutase family protein n=1 Tax=Dyella mobilis TaxID=1849582 RepID=A0ABS2KFK1_9GAMM|nr:isocitrate lyase/phosphoenolpyruvate mutase family protein [Dyella mobilis]MBM7129932.1 isocitrate lyase/phosphoenolpyruvate mutase family protein [Dyella mobilis]GLQ97805.1 phosphonomutase [Dyella mobilis]